MSEWKKVKLGDILQVKKGEYITKKEAHDGIYPVILGGKEPAYYIDKYNHTGKAIVISRSGASAGYVSFWNEPIFVTDGFLIEPKDTLTYEFLYYALKSKQSLLHNAQKGAAIPHVTPSLIGDIDFFLPSADTQHRIATILSRYDSLIENYQKQIELLEEAAQRLYKEWFVDLHFPGHENTKIVEGVPEGWEKKKVKEVCDTTSGGTPSRSKTEFYTGDILWVKTKELNDDFIFDTEEKITEDAIRNSSAKMVPSGSILMAMYGATIGKLGIATKELSCNQACCVFLLPEDSTLRLYLYNWLLNSRTLLISMGKGAAQPNLSQDMIKNLEVVVPSSCLLAKFDSKVKPLYRIMSYHSSQIRLLTEARDRLLPRLMNGEIKIDSQN